MYRRSNAPRAGWSQLTMRIPQRWRQHTLQYTVWFPRRICCRLTCEKPPLSIPQPTNGEKTRTTHPIPTKRIVQMRQSVCVSGLGNAKFTAAMDNLASTFQAMSAALPPTSTVDTWKRSFSNESPTLDIGCRLFTELRVSGFHDDNSFRECEDPTGSMAALKGSKYIHGTDNMVYYGRWNPDAESQEDRCVKRHP